MKNAVKRADFIKHFVDEGLTYTQAEIAYKGMMKAVESGIRNKAKIHLASVGVLRPLDRPPRQVVMGFERSGGTCVNKVRHYAIGPRVEYRFKMHKAFGRSAGLIP